MAAKVSIIVPVYRTGQWLERCVKSILEQTYRQLEVILVDDGSPDECPALCDAFAQRDARVRVIHKENGGLMAAWMDGVRASGGNYLLFVDSDDWIDPCMVDKMLEFSSSCGKEVICGNYIQEEAKRSFPVIQALKPGVYTGRELTEEIFCRLLGEERRPITLSRCMKLFSRSLIEENMRYCDSSIVMGEDVNITLPTLLSAERIVILEDACYYHYLYLNSSMVHRYDPGLYQNIGKLCGIARQILREKHAPDQEGQADREFILLLFLVIKNEVRGGRSGWRKRLQAVLGGREVQETLKRAPLALTGSENRILYRAVKHPGDIGLMGLKLLFGLHDQVRSRNERREKSEWKKEKSA